MSTEEPPENGRRSADERREQLLSAAVTVMSERGVAGATTRAVTQEAGVPHGVFHYCFRSKQEFFSALLEREISKTLASAGRAMEPVADVRTALRAALTAQLDRVRTQRNYHLALAELSLANRRLESPEPLGRWEQRQYRDRTRDDLERWSTGHGITWAVPLDALAAHLVAVGAGVAETWLADGDDASAEVAIDVGARALAGLSSR
jgi:AcrR family transcriptional regulator